MLGLTEISTDAIALLKEDHERVKKIFKEFEEEENSARKKKLVQMALHELKIHATLEEEIFYPAVRTKIKDDDDIMNEADEEHHVAKVLIAELDEMKGTESHYDAKFIVLAENVRHHIKEEEDEMLPKAKKTSVDFGVLGEKMLQRKEELLKNGFPAVGEQKMARAGRVDGDSPALASMGRAPKNSKRSKK